MKEITELYDLVFEFEQRNNLTAQKNPHEEWSRLRNVGPVHKTSMPKLFRGEDFSTRETDTRPCYQVVTYDEAMAVLKNESAFSASAYSESMGRMMGRTFLEMDGHEHKSHRHLVQSHFARKICELYDADFVRPLARKLMMRLAHRKGGDLVRNFTFPLSVLVITKIIGLPSAGLGSLVAWALGLKTEDDGERGREKFIEIIDRRRGEDSQDVIGTLTKVTVDGQRLSDNEIISFIRLLLSTGTEPPYRSLSNLLTGLLSDRIQLSSIKNDRSLIINAVNESMRWEPPLTWVLRTCKEPTEIAGVKFTKDDLVCVNISSANRDEKRWNTPEKFDIYRPYKPHIGMGGGAHMCLGQHLAMIESRAAAEVIVERWPGVHIDREAGQPEIVGRGFRSPRVLPVRF